MSQKDMEQLFSQYGRIITSRILVDQVTGRALSHFSCWHDKDVFFLEGPCLYLYPSQTTAVGDAKVVTLVCFLIRSRHITRSGLHPVWQAKWSGGGHQRSERTEAFGCRWAHHCQVRQQPQPEDGPGLTDSAVPDRCTPLHGTPAPPDSAFQVLKLYHHQRVHH